MTQFLESFAEFAAVQSVWMYIIIFFGKMTEVATNTLRVVLINRGIRLIGSLLAILEIVLWLLITSTVLSGFQEDPLRMVFYALAYAMGAYIGSWLDEKLAFGLSHIQIVVSSSQDAEKLGAALREKGYGVTAMDVHGMDGKQRYMLVTMAKRKTVNEAIQIANSNASSAVITVSDVKMQKGGYLRNSAAGQAPVSSPRGDTPRAHPNENEPAKTPPREVPAKEQPQNEEPAE